MRARSAFFAGAGSVAILAVGWQAGLGQLTQALPTSQPVADGATSSVSNTSSSTTATPAPSASTSTSSSSTSATAAPEPVVPAAPTVADGTYDGAVVDTRWGTVQVQAVMSGGVIADVIAIKLTDADRKSIMISEQAAPILREEVLVAQSTAVANVSGATYTTQAYLQSLQAALDAAGFTG